MGLETIPQQLDNQGTNNEGGGLLKTELELGYELTGVVLAGLADMVEGGNGSRVDTVVEGLKQAGYTSLAAMPLRWVVEKDGSIRQFALPIKFWGQAWGQERNKNTEFNRVASLVGDVWHEKVMKNGEANGVTPVDFLAFPTFQVADSAYFRFMQANNSPAKALTIASHTTNEVLQTRKRWEHHKVYPEIHPELDGTGYSISELVELADRLNTKLTLDTWHVRRGIGVATSEPGRPTVNKLGTWEKDLPQLLDKIGLVHFQPSRLDKTELDKTLLGQPTELADIITMLKEGGFGGDVVVEMLSPTFEQLFNSQSIISRSRDIAFYILQ